MQYEFSSEKLFFHQKSSAFSVKNRAAHAALALNCTGTGLGTGNATATISDPVTIGYLELSFQTIETKYFRQESSK